jgi:hypothetical protein
MAKSVIEFPENPAFYLKRSCGCGKLATRTCVIDRSTETVAATQYVYCCEDHPEGYDVIALPVDESRP